MTLELVTLLISITTLILLILTQRTLLKLINITTPSAFVRIKVEKIITLLYITIAFAVAVVFAVIAQIVFIGK